MNIRYKASFKDHLGQMTICFNNLKDVLSYANRQTQAGRTVTTWSEERIDGVGWQFVATL